MNRCACKAALNKEMKTIGLSGSTKSGCECGWHGQGREGWGTAAGKAGALTAPVEEGMPAQINRLEKAWDGTEHPGSNSLGGPLKEYPWPFLSLCFLSPLR